MWAKTTLLIAITLSILNQFLNFLVYPIEYRLHCTLKKCTNFETVYRPIARNYSIGLTINFDDILA